jgi:isopentenyl phosphate kinase
MHNGRSKIRDMENIVFLKLGGSLITDKTKAYTPRLDKLTQVAIEIKSALSEVSGVKLVLGHGSGSFGHYAVKEQSDLLNLAPFSPKKSEEIGKSFWEGYSEVWFRASQLNRFVMEALHSAGVPAISFPPSAMINAQDGIIKSWDLSPLRFALKVGLVPVIYGDIAFDEIRGGVVLSTEALLFHLAHQLSLKHILLAGLEAAVWADFPNRQQIVSEITPSTFNSISGKVGGSQGMDVTGGMRSKVEEMLRLVEQIPGSTVQIFSGEETGNIEKALCGELLGTMILEDKG